jgi:hypothetical protein
MHALTLPVTTHLFGLGSSRQTDPLFVSIPEQVVLPHDLVAAHVQTEVQRAQERHESSIALHYLLADDVRQNPALPEVDITAEVKRAQVGLSERRFLLVVDGSAIMDLVAPLTLTPHSQIAFIRLLPLIGG